MPVTSPQKLCSKLAIKLKLSSKSPRFHKRKLMVEEVEEEEDLAPPPPPPKEHRQSWISTYCAYQVAEATAFARSSSDSSEASVSAETAGEFGRLFLRRQLRDARVQSNHLSMERRNASLPAPPGTHPPPRPPMQSLTLSSPISRIPQRWPRERRAASTPDEIELRRREATRQKEREEQQALREEAERQARLKREKEEILKRYMEEERERKAALEEELRWAAEQRRKKEAMEREADELKRMVAAEKKRKEKERRIQETSKLQAWRKDQELLARVNQERRQAQRRETMIERQNLASRLKLSQSPNGVIFSGWITIQAEESAPWKRRYFDLTDKTLALFKTAEETAQPLDIVTLSEIRHIKEWHEGFEELEGIPHSFAVEFRTGLRWSLFADSETDKEYLLALLSQEMTD